MRGEHPVLVRQCAAVVHIVQSREYDVHIKGTRLDEMRFARALPYKLLQ